MQQCATAAIATSYSDLREGQGNLSSRGVYTPDRLKMLVSLGRRRAAVAVADFHVRPVVARTCRAD
jgi:hypothetical protein